MSCYMMSCFKAVLFQGRWEKYRNGKKLLAYKILFSLTSDLGSMLVLSLAMLVSLCYFIAIVRYDCEAVGQA